MGSFSLISCACAAVSGLCLLHLHQMLVYGQYAQPGRTAVHLQPGIRLCIPAILYFKVWCSQCRC
jgi:hypothetical protein